MAPRGGDFGGRRPTLPPGLARTEHLSFRACPAVIEGLHWYLAGESLADLMDRLGLALNAYAGNMGGATGRPLSPTEVQRVAGFARRILAGALDALDGNHAHDLSDGTFNAIMAASRTLDDAGL